jgi:hypothetical protein
MNNIDAWQGDTIPLTSTAPDDTAETATLIIGLVGEEAIFVLTAEFELVGDERVADLTISDDANTIAVGEYKYMIQVAYSDGSTLTFPNPDECNSDDLPDFVIKERILNPSES